MHVVEDAQLHRVHVQRLGEFVHRAFQGEHAHPLAGRAHGGAGGQPEFGQPGANQAVFARVEQLGLVGGGLGVPAGQVAGKGVVPHGDEAARLLGPEPQALHGGGAVAGVIENLVPGQHHLDRAPELPRRRRREHRVGVEQQLGAEAPAHVGADDADVLLRHLQGLGQAPVDPVQNLVRGVEREPVAFPVGEAGMRLHRRLRLVGGGVGHVHPNRRRAEGPVKVAHHAVFGVAGRFCLPELRGEVVGSVQAAVTHPDEAGGGAGLLEGVGHHQGNRLVVVVDGGSGELRRGVVLLGSDAGVLALGGHIFVGQDELHARRSLGLGGVDVEQAAVRDVGAEDEPVGGVPQRGVPVLVGVGGLPGDLERPFLAGVGPGQHPFLVERGGSGGFGEFHFSPPDGAVVNSGTWGVGCDAARWCAGSSSFIASASRRRARTSLKAFCSVGRAPSKSLSNTASAPCASSSSAASIRQGRGATPPKAKCIQRLPPRPPFTVASDTAAKA